VPVRLTPYSQVILDTNHYSVPADNAYPNLVIKGYPFRVDTLHLDKVIANHPRCYGREQDISDPLHYLPLLEQRPGGFEHAKPIRHWRAGWPPLYEHLLARLWAQWPDGRGWPWGNSEPDGSKLNLCDVNCEFNCKEPNIDDVFEDTAPLGSFEASKSPYGVYNMGGNVREWVADWYVPDCYRTALNRNPPGPRSGEGRVLRGGSWRSNIPLTPSTYRLWYNSNVKDEYIGFRCAK